MAHEHTEFPHVLPPEAAGESAGETPRGGLLRTLKNVGALAGAIVAIIIAGSFILSGLGFRRAPDLEPRVLHLELRVDSISQRLDFTNYLQCVTLRRSDPLSVPPGCDSPQIQRAAVRAAP